MSMAQRIYETYFAGDNWDYPDVIDREYHPDGSLKGGRYKGIEVTVSRKDDDDQQRTQTLFQDGKPVLIHINGRQALNPAFSWHHEIAHIEDPDGAGEDPVKAEFVADRSAIKKTGMSKKDYQNWLMKSDRSKDSPAHIKARTELHNNFAKHLEESIDHGINTYRFLQKSQGVKCANRFEKAYRKKVLNGGDKSFNDIRKQFGLGKVSTLTVSEKLLNRFRGNN